MDITLPMSEVACHGGIAMATARSGICGGVCLSGLWRHFDRGQQKHVRHPQRHLSARFEIEFSRARNQRIILKNEILYKIQLCLGL